jgi:hypothetical protein
VSHRLLIEVLLESLEQRVELLRLDDRPRNNGEVVLVKPGNEVQTLLHLDNLLELELESKAYLVVVLQEIVNSLLLDVLLVGLHDILLMDQLW